MDISLSSVRPIAKQDLRLKMCKGSCHSIDGTSLLSKVVSNKLKDNVKNGIKLICAKCGASYKP